MTLYTLTKHLDRTMEIVAGLVKESVFPEEQFRIICDINRQQFLVNNQRGGRTGSQAAEPFAFSVLRIRWDAMPNWRIMNAFRWRP